MNYKFLICFFFFFYSVSYTQTDSLQTEEVNGKKYFVHFVQQGNTLYGISKKFNRKAEDILLINPDIENGLQIGQKILVPFDENKIEENKLTYSFSSTHTVQKSETLYSISKRYEITMEDLIKLNPGVENGLSIGQILTLPSNAKSIENPNLETSTEVFYKDSIIFHTVLPSETMYSISKRFMVDINELKKINGINNDKIKKGDVLKIPLKKESIKKIEYRKIEEYKEPTDTTAIMIKKSKYNIVYLLPFHLESNADILTEIATEFWMGSKIALDSLEKMGLIANINVIDVPSDIEKFKEVLKSKELIDANLIIGPFTGKSLELTAQFAKENKIHMISPLSSTSSLLNENIYCYNAINSDVQLMEGLATFLSKNSSINQIIIVKPENKELDLLHAFRLKYQEKNTKTRVIECTLNDLPTFIQKSGMNHVVIPSSDKVFAQKFINQLVKSNIKDKAITIYATKEWINNDDIRGFYKNKYLIHIASPYDFNYTYEETKVLLKKFRSYYNTDLSKYGTQGFDVSYYFLAYFFLNTPNIKGVMNNFNMKPIRKGSGFENQFTYILKQDNYELFQIDKITN
ncbi:MAG: LysM peptidoglycan-binding domain-containing protein [Flavobacteriia bacterium]|nr:LysM peptidoglycan-binding domain-containing protein [Flavobacteriia bacterium]